MRLIPSDPDVATIVSRIENGDIDLQPEFQRGEVWTRLKKQRLIDSILREWHVPPIHVIENPTSRKQEVLDGQQRLAAIRDFVNGHFAVDGTIEPTDPMIGSIDGLRFRELPDEWRRRFNQFTIRLFRIIDYKVAEPSELFFRLNQPTSLTGAEQRNAFFGPVRAQIKKLVDELEVHMDVKGLGFSNSRMAYDDVLSRTSLAIERGSLAEKITSGHLTDLYRSENPLQEETIELIKESVRLLSLATSARSTPSAKFNKATLFSWLMFIVRARLCGVDQTPDAVAAFQDFFVRERNAAMHDSNRSSRMLGGCAPASYLFNTYESRSAARVADVSSVILRDIVIWLAYEEFAIVHQGQPVPDTVGLQRIRTAFDSDPSIGEDDSLSKRLLEGGWANLR